MPADDELLGEHRAPTLSRCTTGLRTVLVTGQHRPAGSNDFCSLTIERQ